MYSQSITATFVPFWVWLSFLQGKRCQKTMTAGQTGRSTRGSWDIKAGRLVGLKSESCKHPSETKSEQEKRTWWETCFILLLVGSDRSHCHVVRAGSVIFNDVIDWLIDSNFLSSVVHSLTLPVGWLSASVWVPWFWIRTTRLKTFYLSSGFVLLFVFC